MADAKIKAKLDLEIKITLELTLPEARALNEIVKYGSKAFLEGYYKQLGKSYLQPYEKGVVILFDTVKKNLPYKIYDADKVIKAVNEIEVELRKK